MLYTWLQWCRRPAIQHGVYLGPTRRSHFMLPASYTQSQRVIVTFETGVEWSGAWSALATWSICRLISMVLSMVAYIPLCIHVRPRAYQGPIVMYTWYLLQSMSIYGVIHCTTTALRIVSDHFIPDGRDVTAQWPLYHSLNKEVGNAALIPAWWSIGGLTEAL